MNNAISILILGPSGSGKSSFLRSALQSLGSGAVASAPGEDELNSYASLRDNEAYAFKGFDDVGYMPSIGSKDAQAQKEILKWQNEIFLQIKSDADAGKQPRWALFGMDTYSAMSQFAMNAALASMSIVKPPAAMSPDGAAFYTLLAQKQQEMMRFPRAMKGFGVHWVMTAHVNERDVNETTSAQVENKTKAIVPAVPGGFRDVLPSFFDIVLHAGVSKVAAKPDKPAHDVHYLRWKPSGKRPTKSRFGSLGDNDVLPNNWDAVYTQIQKAITEQKANA